LKTRLFPRHDRRLSVFATGMMAEGAERLKTLLEVATGIYSEIGESKEVLFNTRAYACLRCFENKARSKRIQTKSIMSTIASSWPWRMISAKPSVGLYPKKSSLKRSIWCIRS